MNCRKIIFVMSFVLLQVHSSKSMIGSQKDKENRYNNRVKDIATERLMQAKSYDDVVEALKRGADVNFIDAAGFTPLSKAVWKGDLGIIKLLLDNGADINIDYNVGPIGKEKVVNAIELARLRDRPEVADFIEKWKKDNKGKKSVGRRKLMKNF